MAGAPGFAPAVRTQARTGGSEMAANMETCRSAVGLPGRVRTDGMCASWNAPPGGA